MQRGSDRGSATVIASIGALLLISITAVVLGLGAASVARHRAEVAADLAALAGAAVILDGRQQACEGAMRIAAANRATITQCETSGADVLVVVELTARIGPAARTATARARAGPVAAQAP